MWAVLYDDGMSLTTASERIARSLAEAERQRGRCVTVRRLDNGEARSASALGSAPAPELTQVPGPAQAVKPAQAAQPASVSEPVSEASPPELTGGPEPARATAPARRRRLLVYALAAASIVVAAALADHWGVLPRAGASTSSSPAQVGGPPHRPHLLPPLDQPPVMHFGSAVNATPTPAGPFAQPRSPAAEPQSATAERSSGGPSAMARGG